MSTEIVKWFRSIVPAVCSSSVRYTITSKKIARARPRTRLILFMIPCLRALTTRKSRRISHSLPVPQLHEFKNRESPEFSPHERVLPRSISSRRSNRMQFSGESGTLSLSRAWPSDFHLLVMPTESRPDYGVLSSAWSFFFRPTN